MKILVATDGSKPVLHAVKYAIKLLRSPSSTSNAITLISVHDDVGLRNAKAFVGKEAVADYLRELSEKDIKSARPQPLDLTNLRNLFFGFFGGAIIVVHLSDEHARGAKAWQLTRTVYLQLFT